MTTKKQFFSIFVYGSEVRCMFFYGSMHTAVPISVNLRFIQIRKIKIEISASTFLCMDFILHCMHVNICTNVCIHTAQLYSIGVQEQSPSKESHQATIAVCNLATMAARRLILLVSQQPIGCITLVCMNTLHKCYMSRQVGQLKRHDIAASKILWIGL